jgi:hypothetical protein
MSTSIRALIIASDPRPFLKSAHALKPTLLTADQSRFEEYREHAAECQEIASHWSDLAKQQYEELARQWLMLAEQVERPPSHFPAQH